jgi:PhnB protein
MKEVTAYLNFDGTARQAMQFYQQCLGGELILSAMPDDKGQPSADPAARIMHSQLAYQGKAILMASDTPPGHNLVTGNNVSVSIQCDSVAEIDSIFAALSEAGQVRQALITAPWGARFGMFTDRFGIHWLLNCQLAQ